MYSVPQGSVLGPILFILYTTPLSDIIANHSVNHQLFADDTQLQKSIPLSEVTNLAKELNPCTDDIKTRMMENQLKLNDNKTDAPLFSFPFRLPWNLLLFPSLTWLLLALTKSPSLGFILDSQLSMKKYIIKICQTAYFELKHTSSIHRFLTEDATKTLFPISSHGLTTATVSSWVHLILSSSLYRKFWALLQDLFSWHPITTTLLLEKLHWLPISECIKYKFTCMCFSAINGSGPAYLSELLHVYTPSCTLRSSSDTHMLEIQQYKCKAHGFHTFSCFGPHIWNSLPQDLRHCSTLSSFKAKLKTFLFSQYFHPN